MFNLSRPWVLDLLSTGGEDMSTTTSMWVWRSDLVETGSVEGFSVEALDGSIGKIDETTSEVGSSYVVVDTGPWIFGKKLMIPAGLVRDIDPDTETIFVNRTKDEIKNAPEFDEKRFHDQAYRDELGSYYSRAR
jgi:hypothetical protein